MPRGPNHREKTLLAFAVYLDLLEAVDQLQNWMRGPFQLFDLTDRGLRLLILLRRRGPLQMALLAREFRCSPSNVTQIVRPLERQGWIRREVTRLAPAPARPSRTAKAKRGMPRRGPRVVLLRLTPLGEKFLAHVFPRHAKVVRALMRALTSKEQQILSRICRKLTQGHILKFMSEVARPDEWEDDAEETAGLDDPGTVRANALSQLLQRTEMSPDDGKETSKDAPSAASGKVPREVPRHAILRALRPDDRERLTRLAQTMRNHDIVRYARNIHWDEPPDRDRDSQIAVEVLMGIGNERERSLLQRIASAMPPPEIIEFLESLTEAVA